MRPLRADQAEGTRRRTRPAIAALLAAILVVAVLWQWQRPGTADRGEPASPTLGAPATGQGSAAPAAGATGFSSLQYPADPRYTLAQAMSDQAQLSTIAFDGLAFLTGGAGADSFFPPGKVADFFGFQYLRDIDAAGYGHNTTFLSKAAGNVLTVLSPEQKSALLALAREQAPTYAAFSYNRFPLMQAFRDELEGRRPAGSSGLSTTAVAAYTANLYSLDATLSYRRAVVVGGIIAQLSPAQKEYLGRMAFGDSSTWPDAPEDEAIKQGLTNDQYVALMTYASELFSWYKGSLAADVYYCPERHGTYFGGFFMKDYPAMNNPDYFISTATTGDKGKAFLELLTPGQREQITGIIPAQRTALSELTQIRYDVAGELRRAQSGQDIDKGKVETLIRRYGALDGHLSALYAQRFGAVGATLSGDQKAALIRLRDLNAAPTGAYAFATPIAAPGRTDVAYLFGMGTMPADAGTQAAPAGYGQSTDPRRR